jgi:hypothetical protein
MAGAVVSVRRRMHNGRMGWYCYVGRRLVAVRQLLDEAKRACLEHLTAATGA